MMKVSTVGIDLVKNLFRLLGVNELGKTVFKKQLRRDQMAEFFVKHPQIVRPMLYLKA